MTRALPAVALAAAALLVPLGTAPASADESAPKARRVLIFSLPHVSWRNIQDNELPNLRRLLDRSGVAALTTRAEQRSTHLADGYLTLGAGTRAVGDPASDGDNLGVDERFGSDSAGDVFTQRTGRVVRHGIVSLAEPRVVNENDSLLYDAELGAFADALRHARVHRAVIANADGRQPDTPPSPSSSTLRRQAALALMGSDGTVPAGTIDDGLLERAPHSPFGVQLDDRAVLRAFDATWRPRSVVLVEASDLVRADAYRPWATSVHRAVMVRRALQRSDDLLGRLLRRVDLRRDAVIVLGPAHSSQGVTLTVLGVHAPGVEPGLLRSATTRRSGFVQLVDVAPTVLDLLGVDRPTSMEGRAVEVGSTGGSAADRIDLFVREDAAAQFRDLRVGEVQMAFVVFTGALVAGLIFLTRRPRPAWVRVLLGRVALCVLAFVPAVFLARLVPLHEVGFLGYWAYLVVVSVALGTLYHRVGRTTPTDALLAALLFNVVLLAIDVILGASLEFNSALGYSPTVAGRFSGFSNPAYAALGASAVLAAPLLAARVGGRHGIWAAVGLLGAVVVVDGAPFWGSDVGGILSLVPACAVTAILLLGWRVRWRTVLWCLAALAGALVAFTLLDLSRPPGRRTHLGRLVERIQDRGFGEFVTVVERKLTDNLGSLTHSVWGVMLPLALVLGLWLVRRAPDRVQAIRSVVPDAHIALIGLAILAVLGYALNDSGVAIPGVMLVILVTAVAWLLTRSPEPHLDAPVAARPRARVPVS